MKRVLSKNRVILTLSFLTIAMLLASTSFAKYDKVTFNGPACPPNPYANYFTKPIQDYCALTSGKWIWIETSNPKTKEFYETKLTSNGVQLVSSKTKKSVVNFSGPEASAFLLMSKDKITEPVLIKALVYAYKISETNAKAHINKVRKVLVNLNLYRGEYRTNKLLPAKYVFYRFY